MTLKRPRCVKNQSGKHSSWYDHLGLVRKVSKILLSLSRYSILYRRYRWVYSNDDRRKRENEKTAKRQNGNTGKRRIEEIGGIFLVRSFHNKFSDRPRIGRFHGKVKGELSKAVRSSEETRTSVDACAYEFQRASPHWNFDGFAN